MRLCCCIFGIVGVVVEEELFMGGYLCEMVLMVFIVRCENNVCVVM